MKKIVLLGAALILFVIGCNSLLDGRIAKVSVSKSNGFSEVNTDFFVVYEDKASIKIVKKAITGAERQPGIVNMAEPEYDVELMYANGNKTHYYLWLGDEGISTVMHVNDTHTVYSIEGKMNTQLVALLSKHVD